MENKKDKQIEEQAVDMTIDPNDIIIAEDDDSDMPEPETKNYDNTVKLTDKFMSLFDEVTGKLPYASILKNGKGDQIKLINLVKYVETKRTCIPLTELDKVLSFIANVEFKQARPLMEMVENQEMQKLLWTNE